jgi:hypothetical protein
MRGPVSGVRAQGDAVVAYGTIEEEAFDAERQGLGFDAEKAAGQHGLDWFPR